MLNSVPDNYTPTLLGINQSMGVGYAVSVCYEQFLDGGVQAGFIEKNGTSREVEPEVVAMLKAVLMAGCTRIEERADACRKVFDACLPANTKADFISLLPTGDAFVEDITKSIKGVWGR